MDRDILRQVNRARSARKPAIVVTNTETGEDRLMDLGHLQNEPLAGEAEKRLRSGKSGMLDDGRTFLTVQVPPPRLVTIGAVHISQALAPMARIAGLDMRVIDPRTAFATEDRFPGTPLNAEWPDVALSNQPLDAFTAVAALTHDPKIDDLPLRLALEAKCFYVGALGSRKTHAGRLERLKGEGVSEQDLNRIKAPIGLDIGAASPAEIAVAVLAQIITALRKPRTD